MAINDAFVDAKGIPIQNIRIRHSIVLEDPFPDPPMLADHIPEKSPEPEFTKVRRLGACQAGAMAAPGAWDAWRLFVAAQKSL